MKRFKSPIYPALALYLDGDRRVKAMGGVFEIEDEDVKAFEKAIKQRPHYQIAALDPEPVDQPPKNKKPTPTPDEGGEADAAQ